MIDTEALIRIARPATELALAYAARRQQIRFQEKTPGQFASEADQAVEEVIRSSLLAEFRRVAILGEETGGALDDTVSGWAVDPIDGTSNFLRGLPLWGISIGLLSHGRPTAGIIVMPELGLTLASVDGGGVVLNGTPYRRSGGSPGGKMIALGENDFEPGSDTDARAEGLRRSGFAVVRYRCAVFALTSAALGRLDGYIEHGCGLWDIAAAWIICKEAGMRVEVSEVAPARYSIEALGED